MVSARLKTARYPTWAGMTLMIFGRHGLFFLGGGDVGMRGEAGTTARGDGK
jgi:hypothetical protein